MDIKKITEEASNHQKMRAQLSPSQSILEQINAIYNPVSAVNKALYGHGSAVNKALYGHGSAVNKALYGHGSAVNKALYGHGSAVNKALYNPASALNSAIYNPASALNSAIYNPASALNSAIYNPASALNSAIYNPASALSSAIYNPASALNSAIYNPASALSSALYNATIALNKPINGIDNQASILNTHINSIMPIGSALAQSILSLTKIQNFYDGMAIPLAHQQALEHQKQALLYHRQFKIPSMLDVSYPLGDIGKIIEPKTLVRRGLQEGLWTIDDEAIIEHLANNPPTESGQEEYICYYYSNNRWAKLADIVKKWAECEFISERHHILKACFKNLIFSHGENTGIEHIIIPTLIAQIDGIKQDILNIVPENIELNPNFIQDKPKKYIRKTDIDHQKICSAISELISPNDATIFYDVICRGVFQSSEQFKRQKQEGTNTANFNRHRIIHGDKISLDYGTTENVIRAFLYIDFMVKIIVKLNNKTYH